MHGWHQRAVAAGGRCLLALIISLATLATASAEQQSLALYPCNPEQFQDFGGSDSPTARVAVAAGERAYLFRADGDCPAAAGCQRKAYLVGGDRVVVGVDTQGWSCVWFAAKNSEVVGWMASTSLKAEPLPQLQDGDWLGEWHSRSIGSSLTIAKATAVAVDNPLPLKLEARLHSDDGALSVETALSGDYMGERQGEIEAYEQPDSYSCRVNAGLSGGLLRVTDNGNCGPGVSYAGLYRRGPLPPPPPPSCQHSEQLSQDALGRRLLLRQDRCQRGGHQPSVDLSLRIEGAGAGARVHPLPAENEQGAPLQGRFVELSKGQPLLELASCEPAESCWRSLWQIDAQGQVLPWFSGHYLEARLFADHLLVRADDRDGEREYLAYPLDRLQGEPVLAVNLHAFAADGPTGRAEVVCTFYEGPSRDEQGNFLDPLWIDSPSPQWLPLCEQWQPQLPHRVTPGLADVAPVEAAPG